MDSPEMNKEHDWKLIAEPYTVKTCERCGLIRLETLSNVFYFVQFTNPYINCYHRGSEDTKDAKS